MFIALCAAQNVADARCDEESQGVLHGSRADYMIVKVSSDLWSLGRARIIMTAIIMGELRLWGGPGLLT